MTDSATPADGAELMLRGQALELTLAALEAERERVTAKYDRRIAQVRDAIERAEAAKATPAEPMSEAAASGTDRPSEIKPASKRQSRSSTRGRTRSTKSRTSGQ
jgi:LPS O-antigen subunit length determinant protein (WzzB/FepE family)